MAGKKEKKLSFFEKFHNFGYTLNKDLKYIQDASSEPASEMPENAAILGLVGMQDDVNNLMNSVTKNLENVHQISQDCDTFISNAENIKLEACKQIERIEEYLASFGFIPSDTDMQSTLQASDEIQFSVTSEESKVDVFCPPTTPLLKDFMHRSNLAARSAGRIPYGPKRSTPNKENFRNLNLIPQRAIPNNLHSKSPCFDSSSFELPTPSHFSQPFRNDYYTEQFLSGPRLDFSTASSSGMSEMTDYLGKEKYLSCKPRLPAMRPLAVTNGSLFDKLKDKPQYSRYLNIKPTALVNGFVQDPIVKYMQSDKPKIKTEQSDTPEEPSILRCKQEEKKTTPEEPILTCKKGPRPNDPLKTPEFPVLSSSVFSK